MSDTTVPALLEELWEVDFETWKDIMFLISNSMMFNEPREIPLEQHIYHDIIQGCIQRAIAARGWEYQIAYQPIKSDDRRAQAYIWPPDEILKCYESEADTPAAAILAAYIETKRAMR